MHNPENTNNSLFIPGKEQIKSPAENTLLSQDRTIFQDSLGYFKRKQVTN